MRHIDAAPPLLSSARAVCALLAAWLLWGLSVTAVDSQVVPTNTFIFVFDSSDASTFEDQPLAPGDVIDAYDPDGVRCGSLTVAVTGQFPAMPVYGDDASTPAVDEGASVDDPIRFEINGRPAAVTSGGPVVWTADRDTKDIVIAGPASAPVSTHTYELPAGWSMISLPVIPADAALQAVFPGAISVFRFAGSYASSDTLVPGQGYWINLAAADTFRVDGERPTALEMSLPAGWSMVGPVDSTALGDLDDATGGKLISVFGFTGSYQSVPALAPTEGYWINMAATASVDWADLPTATTAAARSAAATAPTATAALWAEASRQRRDLPLGGPLQVAPSEVLPPVPPSTNLLDLRAVIAGLPVGRVPALEAGATVPLLLQGRRARLGWHIPQGEPAAWELLAGARVVPLVGSGHLEAAELAGAPLALRASAARPAALRLGPNYPNPFNPATSIPFYLDRAGPVSLTIHDLAGQRIRTLVADRFETGAHTASWDGRTGAGTRVASGAYLCVLQSPSGLRVRKLVLLR